MGKRQGEGKRNIKNERKEKDIGRKRVEGGRGEGGTKDKVVVIC